MFLKFSCVEISNTHSPFFYFFIIVDFRCQPYKKQPIYVLLSQNALKMSFGDDYC